MNQKDPLGEEFYEKFCRKPLGRWGCYFYENIKPEEVFNWFKAKLNKDVSDFNLSQCLDYWKKVHGLAFEEGSPRHYLGMVDIIRITEKAKKLEAKLKEKDKRYIDALATIDQYAVVQQDMIHKDILDVQLEPALAAQKKKAVEIAKAHTCGWGNGCEVKPVIGVCAEVIAEQLEKEL